MPRIAVSSSPTFRGSSKARTKARAWAFSFRHIERTSLLLHLIDVSEGAVQDPVASFEIMREELAAYDAAVASVPLPSFPPRSMRLETATA